MITPILVDQRNFHLLKDQIVEKVKSSVVIGFDIETFDNAHAGIKSYRNKKRLVFDVKRTTVAGASIYCNDDTVAYYFNFNHADSENRLDFNTSLKPILDEIKPTQRIVAHNAPFEITMMGESLGYEFGDNLTCTLQMAVSAYGPDEYPRDKWVEGRLGEVKKLFKDIRVTFHGWKYGDTMNPDQHELMMKVISKTSDASHCYNGFVKSISYGYGLKQATKSWFDYDMVTFDEVLGDKEHMGKLTGEEVLSYGADDAYWCVRLFYKLLEFMQGHCPNAIKAFITQENPMIHTYAGLWREGLLVNQPAIKDREGLERAAYAQGLRDLKNACKDLLPFPQEHNEFLLKYDKWYAKKPDELRQRFEDWINLPNVDDDYQQCTQVSSAVANDWMGIASTKNKNLSIQHYYQVRLLMYDLMRMKPYVSKGKTESDADARSKLSQRLAKYEKLELQDCEKLIVDSPDFDKDKHIANCKRALKEFGNLASIDQRVKLYITPYLKLTDPETNRMYPVLSSKLASRRMAMSYPNGMQLSKNGDSSYVRGFYEPDEKDHVTLSVDWSQIELVLIGERSGDPEFAKAYAQKPYEDLHIGAAADVLAVASPEISEEVLKMCDLIEDDSQIPSFLLFDTAGNPIPKGKRRGYWRGKVGKVSNFNYWYSGALATVAENLGWSSDQMWAATERYRNRFAVAEKWRVNLIDQARLTGFIELPDGHRRYREEVTHRFASEFTAVFESYRNPALNQFGFAAMKKIASRAGNQIVNSEIQGSCATLAKRSILNINKEIKDLGFRGRFKLPVHDELAFSIHREEVVPFIKVVKEKMCDHPEIISNLAIDCTASIGLTFEPWKPEKAPIGQIELDEAPDILGFTPDSRLNDDQIQETVNYLFKKREELNG